MESHIILSGLDTEKFLDTIREIIRNEVKSLPQPPKEKTYLTLTEASEFTGLSKATIYNKTHGRKIPFIKADGKLLFNRKDLTVWLESGRQPVEI